MDNDATPSSLRKIKELDPPLRKDAVDNIGWKELLAEGVKALGLSVSEEAVEKLVWFGQELVRWNARVNLTAVTEPEEVIEKHLLDSLAVLPEVGEAKRLLDLGSGAGLPGLALKIARPQLEVEVVDTVGKKISFSKHAIAQLRLFPGARATQARAEGAPEKEGLAQADIVVSRAFMDVEPWTRLARAYVAPGGRVLALSGRADDATFERAARESGLTLEGVRRLALPFSQAPRVIGVLRAPA